MVACTECGAEVRTDSELRVGEVLHCTSCSAELEVINTNPVEFVLAPEVEEDWGE